jgi:hypothetical protein
MKKSLFLVFILLGSFTQAQVNVDWSNFPGGVAVALDSIDNVYTANWDYNPAGDITLTKRNSSGTILWEMAYDNTDNTRHEVATWVETDKQGNILVSGTIRSGISNPVNAASLLMKFDASGTLIWRVVFDSTFDGSSTKKILVDSNNNTYVIGLGMGTNGLVTRVKKFDASGLAVWDYFDSGIGAPFNFKFTPDHHIIITHRGYNANFNAYSKIDLNGNLVWNTSGMNSYSAGDAAGDIYGNTYLINGEYVISNAGSIITKLSPSGALLWSQTIAMGGNRVEIGTDNYPVISGYPQIGYGAALMKFNDTGNMLWQNLDADGPGIALLAQAYLMLDEYNAAYLAGSTMSQMGVCKVNPDGTSAWTATIPVGYPTCLTLGTDNSVYVTGGTTAKLGQSVTTGISPINKTKGRLEIYPNPVTDQAIISFETEEVGEIAITITDGLGRTIKSFPLQKCQSGKNNIPIVLSELDPGLYFAIIKSNQTVQVQLIIKN